MVTVTNYKKSQTEGGKEFFSLEIQGGIEAMQARSTGRYYLTTRSCLIPTTFDEATCASLVGSILPGRVAKVECLPYEHTVKETGEVITVNHRWEYQPEEAPSVQKKDFIVPQHLVVG